MRQTLELQLLQHKETPYNAPVYDGILYVDLIVKGAHREVYPLLEENRPINSAVAFYVPRDLLQWDRDKLRVHRVWVSDGRTIHAHASTISQHSALKRRDIATYLRDRNCSHEKKEQEYSPLHHYVLYAEDMRKVCLRTEHSPAWDKPLLTKPLLSADQDNLHKANAFCTPHTLDVAKELKTKQRYAREHQERWQQ